MNQSAVIDTSSFYKRDYEPQLGSDKHEQEIILIISATLSMLTIYLIIENRKLKQLEEKLRNDLGKLEQLSQSKDELLSIISHDLRSSVHALQVNVGKLKALLNKIMFKEGIPIVEKTEQIVTSTLSLLNNLLYWSLSQNNRLTYFPETLSLKPLLNQVTYDFLPIAASKNIALNYTISNDFIFTADANSIKLILRNLIDNALKYTLANGTVTITANRDSRSCHITVRDNGIGMSQETISTIFSHSSRRIQQDAYGKRSTGIGLWLSKNMAERNGGSLSIESTLGSGTSVTLSLLVNM